MTEETGLTICVVLPGSVLRDDSRATMSGNEPLPNAQPCEAIHRKTRRCTRFCELAFLRNEFAFPVVHRCKAESLFSAR